MDNFDLKKYISEGRMLKEELSYAFSEYDFTIGNDAYQAEVEAKIKKELKKVQSKPLEIPEKDLQAIIKNAENYFAKEARKEEKANRSPRKIKSTEFAQFAADYYTEEYYPEEYGKDYPDKRGNMQPIQKDFSSEFKERRRRSDIIPVLIDYDVKGKDSTKSIGLYNMPDDYYTMDMEEFDKKYGVYKRREIKRRADRLKDPDFPTEKLQDKPGGPLKLPKDFYTMRVYEFDNIYGKGGEIEDEDFNIEDYLAEGKLFEEELTPLQKYIFNYEKDISDKVDIKAIKRLKNANDVYDYYANERGWEGDEDLEDDLNNIYNQVKARFAEGKLHENLQRVAKSVDDVIDPADYVDIGKGYLKAFNRPHSLNDDELEILGRKVVKSLYKGDFEKAKAKFINEQLDLSSREYSAEKLFALIARDLKFSSRVQDNEMLSADEALEIMRKVIEIEGTESSPEAALGEYIANGEL